MIGGSIEIATQLLVPWPAVRPFAGVLAAEVSAIAQFGDALRASAAAANQLDKADRIRREQVAIANSMRFILQNNETALDGMSGPEINLVLSAAADPFSRLTELNSGRF